MEPLDKKYQKPLLEIKKDLLASEEFARYLEEEEEEDYQLLKDQFEPRILLIYEKVAAENPLQIIDLERQIMDEEFEGLFLPKLLGFSVLRGEITKDYIYARPQNHFKDLLLAICHSANFDYLRKRIGQTIQIGFAFSSDIWITNLIEEVENKRIRYFLQGQKLKKYRDPDERMKGYKKYKNQFRNDNFYTTDFPETLSELKTLFWPLYNFLTVRILQKADNTSLIPHIKAFLDNKEFQKTDEYLKFFGLYASFFPHDDKEQHAHLTKAATLLRKNKPDFIDKWMHFLLELFHSDTRPDDKSDRNFSSIIDKSKKDELSAYYKMTDEIHTKGFAHEDVIQNVNIFYTHHAGLSEINECIREVIYGYFHRLLTNLELEDYPELFEIAKLFPVYIDIFSNQKFNQKLKDLCMSYVKKLLRKYTDKRGKDYQDIKKFVSTTFKDLGFLTDKQITELFKTRRKRKPTAA